MTTRRFIFHVPYRLQFDNPNGGGVRPVKMLRAFEELGEVWVIQGDARERRGSMARVEDALKGGVEFDLCYSESSTMPTALTESHHLPTHPFLDFSFFRRLRRAGVPVGLFYRDIEWRFPMYKRLVPWYKAFPALAMYRFDLFAYGRTLDRIFLPSLEMAEWVPLPKGVRVSALPPGHDVKHAPQETAPAPLRLIYVGGFLNKYRLHEVLAAVHSLPDVHLTICTRPDEWTEARAEYEESLGENIQVIHKSGAELQPYFDRSNVAVVAAEPQEYWRFAAPLKVFEYLGNALPILASRETLAGRLVEDWGVGWTVDYDRAAIAAQLRELISEPARVSKKRAAALALGHRHLWVERARQVVEELSGEHRSGGSLSF